MYTDLNLYVCGTFRSATMLQEGFHEWSEIGLDLKYQGNIINPPLLSVDPEQLFLNIGTT